MGFLYKSCLSLSTALRILIPIAQFKAQDPEDLYKQASELNWSELILPDQKFAIQFTVHSELFPHSQFAALKLKDALVDAMRKQTGKRPDVDRFEPDLLIDLMISNDQVHLSLDATGAPLFKRGYRQDAVKAPLNEVLAAGLIRMSGWDGRVPLFDPFCGSGTLLIEACLYHMNIPPSLFRENFIFQRWKDYDPDLFEKVRNSRLDQVREPSVEFIGSDRDERALNKAFNNIQNAGLEEMIKLEKADFFDSPAPFDQRGFMVTNPPYGIKLEVDSSEFFADIGDNLKQNYNGWEAWIILPDDVKSIGLRHWRRFPVLNGDIECKWTGYKLFEGSKKRGDRNY